MGGYLLRWHRPGPVRLSPRTRRGIANSDNNGDKAFDIFDCAIIGAGAAGRFAGVYLARFRRNVVLMTSGESRARLIPRTHNVPGYAGGITGPELLAHLDEQLACYDVTAVKGHVTSIAKDDGGFLLEGAQGVHYARRVILATGVRDCIPNDLSQLSAHIGSGLVRLCPVCDAFEVSGKRIGLISRGRHAVREAMFLSAYSKSVALLTHGQGLADAIDDLDANIAVHTAAVQNIARAGPLAVTLIDGKVLQFDALYAGFGVEVHSHLAAALGAKRDPEGYLTVDQMQETSVRGLYAAGDVVQSLSQISVAFGQAAIAASAVNISLNREGHHARPPGYS